MVLCSFHERNKGKSTQKKIGRPFEPPDFVIWFILMYYLSTTIFKVVVKSPPETFSV